MAKQNSTRGGRSSGGIIGPAASNITPIYKQTIPSGSVKVVPAIPGRPEMAKIESAWKSDPTAAAARAASRLRADTAKAQSVPKKPTVKINSGRGMGGGGLNINKVR